jgi:hypothetical protein
MHQGRVAEAKLILQTVTPASLTGPQGNDFDLRFYERAQEMLREVEAKATNYDSIKENSFIECLKPTTGKSLQCPWRHTAPNQSEHEMPNSDLGDWEMTTFHATSGFALSQQEFMMASDTRFQASLFDNAWVEDKTEEDDFGDENININTISSVSASSQGRATFGFPQNPQTQHSNVEALRERLEKVCLKENSSVKHSAFLPSNSSYTEQSSLNSAAATFFSKYAYQRQRQSTFSNGLGSMAGFEERVPLMLDRINEKRQNPLGPIGRASTRDVTKSENTNPVHQKKVLGPIGSGSSRNTVKSENTNAVHQKKVLGPIGSGFTRNITKYENTNPGEQRAFVGQSSHNENKRTTNHLLSFESMDSGLDLPSLPIKKTMAMTRNKLSMTLPMQEKNAAADPCDSLGYIQLPDMLEFEQAMISCISEAANSDQAYLPEKQKLQDRLLVFQEITLNAHKEDHGHDEKQTLNDSTYAGEECCC